MKYVETPWGYEWKGPLHYLKLARENGTPRESPRAASVGHP